MALHSAALERGLPTGLSFESGDAGAPGPGEMHTPDPSSDLSLDAEDLIHFHGSADWAGALRHAAKTGMPSVVTIHDLRIATGGCVFPGECTAWKSGCTVSCPLGFADAAPMAANIRAAVDEAGPSFAAPSAYVASFVREVFPQHHVHIVPNGVQVPARQPGKRTAKADMGIAPDAGVVLFCAHGGVRAGLKAGDRWRGLWSQIEEHAPGTLCFMVGGDAYERHGNLFVWPYVDASILQRLMAAADVLAYPSTADNHPLVVLEAMAQGCVPVAFPVGGIPEQIIHGQAGFLTKGNDLDELTETAVSLLKDGNLRRKLSFSVHERARRLFQEQHMVAAYEELYRKVLGVDYERTASDIAAHGQGRDGRNKIH